jgi:hypothetical protein
MKNASVFFLRSHEYQRIFNDKTTIKMNFRSHFSLFAAASILLLAGCQSFIENKTPTKIEANASDLYTFKVRIDEALRHVVPGSMNVGIVINGETHEMQRDTESKGKYTWTIDYPVPNNVSEVPYYFIATYFADHDGARTKETEYSTNFTTANKPYLSIIANRYVIKISSPRSPVGATIAVVGQGFTDADRIVVGDVEAQTSLVSHSHINFVVPNMPAGKTYKVVLRTTDGDTPAGTLRIDPSTIGVQPSNISLKSGESIPVTFFIDSPAPAGGLTIDVQTAIPESVIMPVVTIPEGQRSVSVTIQGGKPGSAFLIINADGFEKAKIPISVE